MLDFTKIYFFIFGVLTIVGGVIGFVKASSNASLIAGSICGLALLAAGYLLSIGKVQPGLILGFLVSLALAYKFIPPFIADHKPMPAGMMTALSVVSIVLIALTFAKK